MTLHDLPFDDGLTAPRGLRSWSATALHAASRALDTLAARLALVKAPAPAERVLEFYADAGAPEGALYINGELVGRVLGVTRL